MIEERYSRQVLLPEIKEKGQKMIQKSKVAIIGLGALGSMAAELLVRLGVNNLQLIDRDVVEESNLPRQLFLEKDIGRSKAIAAKERLEQINSKIIIDAQPIHLNAKNISLLQKADLILDCTDNLQTRFLVNDFCRQKKKKWIYAAAIKTKGYVMPILPSGPCLKCFIKNTEGETCDTVGVVNTITASIAALQVTLALKIILEKKIEPLLYSMDIWRLELKTFTVKPNPQCLTCQGNFLSLQPKPETKYIKFCSSERYQIIGKARNFRDLKKKWEKIDRVIEDQGTLTFKNLFLFKDGRVLIKAKSEAEALSAYSKWIGN